MTMYHLAVESPDGNAARNDLVARTKMDALQPQVDAVGGTLTLSRGFGMGPAFLVLTLQDASIEQVLPDETEWERVGEEQNG